MIRKGIFMHGMRFIRILFVEAMLIVHYATLLTFYTFYKFIFGDTIGVFKFIIIVVLI